MARPKSEEAKKSKLNPADEAYQAGLKLLMGHPLFQNLLTRAIIYRNKKFVYPEKGLAYVHSNGTIFLNPVIRAEPEQWTYAIAHCLLHLAFEHFKPQAKQREWDLACDIVVHHFLAGLKFGRPPKDLVGENELASYRGSSESALYQRLCREGFDPIVLYSSLTGTTESDMRFSKQQETWFSRQELKWPEVFAAGLQNAVTQAIGKVAGSADLNAKPNKPSIETRRARDWFINSYPLLGSLAASFDFLDDPLICQRGQISVAAVNTYSKEIFLNPAAGLTQGELRFVIAHELLHAALRHDVRRENRDPYLWNVACDYVINLWLVEMEVGTMPLLGGLFDESLKGLSAESIYDMIARDLRRYRKLRTMRGFGLSDMIEDVPGWWRRGDGVSLDEFYRNAIAQGLCYHQGEGRGFLPAGLAEEIKALAQPPIPWDVQLAYWFDEYFPPVEKHRSYGRLSRRQSSTPDIPIPRYVTQQRGEARTFGVVIDTSGSMPRTLLAQALGAIASYSISRDVPAVRLVSCDAAPFDHGFVAPEEIADRMTLRGRGGTVLQPGIDLLAKATDFPERGPLLVITDGWCDCFTSKMDHAILLPAGRSLPFAPRVPVFRFSE